MGLADGGDRGGYRSADGGEPVARARPLSAAPGSGAQCGRISRRRCCASVRATRPADGGEWGSQMAVNGGGYRSADGGEPVARARRVKRRPREQSAQCSRISRRRCCTSVRATRPADGGEWGSQTAVNRGGYRLTGGGEPVARARRVKRRPREQSLARVGKFTAIAPLLSLRTPPPGRGNRRPGL